MILNDFYYKFNEQILSIDGIKSQSSKLHCMNADNIPLIAYKIGFKFCSKKYIANKKDCGQIKSSNDLLQIIHSNIKKYNRTK